MEALAWMLPFRRVGRVPILGRGIVDPGKGSPQGGAVTMSGCGVKDECGTVTICRDGGAASRSAPRFGPRALPVTKAAVEGLNTMLRNLEAAARGQKAAERAACPNPWQRTGGAFVDGRRPSMETV